MFRTAIHTFMISGAAGMAGILSAESANSSVAHDQEDHATAILNPSDAEENTAYGKTISVDALLGEQKSATPDIDEEDFWVFVYSFVADIDFRGIRWHAITDITSEFVAFNSTGTIVNPGDWLDRNEALLPGEVAEAAGVGVHLTIVNQGFENSVTEAVMNNAANRNRLINEITDLIKAELTANAPGYIDGVTFDFEPFSWSSTTSGNLAIFFEDIRERFDNDPQLAPLGLDISWYVDPTPNSTQFSNLGSYVSNIDKILYSMYDYGTGNAPRAVSDYDSSLIQQTEYLELYGVPPEKFVPVVSTYSRRYPGAEFYRDSATSSNTGLGFSDALFATTLQPNPAVRNYVIGDETSWYFDGSAVVVNPLEEGLEIKFRQALSYPHTASVYRGRKLGGIGIWAAFWNYEATSFDFNRGTNGTFTRTYTQPYEIFQQALTPPGAHRFLIEKFEGFNARWEDPNTGPDDFGDTDGDSSRFWTASPGGTGAPPNSTNALRIDFDFESFGVNQLFFRHEILGDETFTTIRDTKAVAGFIDKSSEIRAYIHAGENAGSGALPNARAAIVVLDADGELERGPLFPLRGPAPPTDIAGWQTITFDLAGDAAVGYTTQDAIFGGASANGDGIIDSALTGERDIALAGILIEVDGSGNREGTLYIDEISYTNSFSTGPYVINEVRYDGAGGEFIEIYGPAGPLPAGLDLVLIDPDGARNPIALSGVITDAGSGFGYYVVGDPGVRNVDQTAGFEDFSDNISNGSPAGVQLFDQAEGGARDSFVYEAFGGLGDLVRQQQFSLVDEGFPWAGRAAGGTDASGEAGSFGRYPDGHDSDWNYRDFSLQIATPGAQNAGAIDLANGPVRYDFESAPPTAFQTFDQFAVTTSAVGSSPSGGNVYRCVDPVGGGVMAFFGDQALGSRGDGYRVAGEIYLPGPDEPQQAVAIGFCGTQGSAFFSSFRDGNSYENGYMLIYENRAGVGLDNGRPDHPGVIEFLQATHDNMDGAPVELLASAPAPVTGGWTTFELLINPAEQLLAAAVGGISIYTGAIPEEGPTSGAVTVGFRENHAGAPQANEGTWIDNLRITRSAGLIIDQFLVY